LSYDFNSGTVLKISNLRDNWDDYFVSQVFDDLEVLAPPKEQGNFKLFILRRISLLNVAHW
jgi:hypothetical protein